MPFDIFSNTCIQHKLLFTIFFIKVQLTTEIAGRSVVQSLKTPTESDGTSMVSYYFISVFNKFKHLRRHGALSCSGYTYVHIFVEASLLRTDKNLWYPFTCRFFFSLSLCKTLHRLAARALVRDWEIGSFHRDLVSHETRMYDLKKYLTDLSIRLSVVTPLTSFIAVEKRDGVNS